MVNSEFEFCALECIMQMDKVTGCAKLNSEFVIRNYGIASGDNILKTFIETLQGERTTFALCILL